jgi:UDP-GlcNAc:undecaprenyl-phosphate/decaprenyl-phosphate GlcNAc-1-phosphate transferase
MNALSMTLSLGFVVSLALSLWLTPVIRTWSLKNQLVDQPGERKIHRQPISRLGGVAIFLSFALSFGLSLWLMVASDAQRLQEQSGLYGLLWGGLLMFILGVVDDLKNLPAPVKLVGQLLAAGAAIWGGVEIHTLDLPGSKLLILNALSIPVTVLWLVGVTNAMNFIDGVDGLASGVGILSCLALFVVAIFTGQPLTSLVALLLCGAILGFWVHNHHPAKIFMGDSGALFIGMMLGMLSVSGVLKTQIVVMLLPLLILIAPILDITYATFRRLWRGKNPLVADADHIHHRLLQAGFSQQNTVFIFYVAHLITGMLATGYLSLSYLGLYLLLSLGMVILCIILLKIFRTSRSDISPPSVSV